MISDPGLCPEHKAALVRLGQALIDQEAAPILVEPLGSSYGYWFGGGNIVRLGGRFATVGRYRNEGDSRTGVGAGERGLELAVFEADDFGGPWEKTLSLSKQDLAHSGTDVVSIEGTSLLPTADGIELYVSTEKALSYPEDIAGHQKPGTGVWEIDRLTGPDLASLNPANAELIAKGTSNARLHAKDPKVFADGDRRLLIYCNHPFSWSSSNATAAVAETPGGPFRTLTEQMLERGPVWDISVARVTDRLLVPQVGAFADLPPVALYFYDGAECLRSLDENPNAVKRPRGYSCEEIGGLAWGWADDFPHVERLSVDAPLFLSPQGTGCSRYVSCLAEADAIYATWQQSQEDLRQPLVGHSLLMSRVEEILM